MSLKKLHTKSGVRRSPLLLFRKPEFFHTFSVIGQQKNYRKCFEDVEFSKKRQRTALHPTFSVLSLSSLGLQLGRIS